LRPQNHKEESEYPADASCQLAEPIKCGTVIRLTHTDTKRNLHSHGVESVLSRQQEVSCFGSGDGKGDGGDDWKVECANPNAKYWKRNSSVRMKHIDTGKYLGTYRKLEFNHETCGHNCPIMNHLEAFGRASVDSYTLLTVEQGIHLGR
jgi:dolichyl-phosphate-mannose--protein O-mannosyl transferase